MRISTCLLVVTFFAPALAAQTRSICAAPDSAPIVAWHSRWDTVISYSARTDDAQSGIITIPVDPAGSGYTPGDREAIYGHYRLVAILVGKRGTDMKYNGELWLSPPTKAFLARNEFDPHFSPDRAVSGAIVGSGIVGTVSGNPQDSMPVEGYFHVAGHLSFSDQLGVMDGGGFWVEKWDGFQLQGWWHTPGAMVPPPLGYFCATRDR
jgi:hypothetical protein